MPEAGTEAAIIYTSEKVDELEKAYYQARQDHQNLDSDRAIETGVLLRVEKERIEKDMDAKYRLKQEKLRDAEIAALNAYHDYIEAYYSQQLALAGYPIGTKLFKWAGADYRHLNRRDNPLRLNGVVAQIEVVTRNSVFSSNISHSQPPIGSYLLRILKKDGSPSTKFETLKHRPFSDAPDIPDCWQLEGVDGEAVRKRREEDDEFEELEMQRFITTAKNLRSNVLLCGFTVGQWVISRGTSESDFWRYHLSDPYVDISVSHTYVFTSGIGWRFQSQQEAEDAMRGFRFLEGSVAVEATSRRSAIWAPDNLSGTLAPKVKVPNAD